MGVGPEGRGDGHRSEALHAAPAPSRGNPQRIGDMRAAIDDIAVDGEVGSTHGELPHHATILMLQNVAVIHIGILLGCRMVETHDNLRPVVVIQHHHIFPASLIWRRRCSFHSLYQERAAVHMERMCALVGTNTPTFPDAAWNPFINDVHIHHRTVDGHIHGSMAALLATVVVVFGSPTILHSENKVTGSHYFLGLRADNGGQLLR